MNIDINSRDKMGRTALMYAIVDRELDKVKTLICNGADVNLQDNNGLTALHFSVQNYLIDAVKLLLDSGARVDVEDSNGNTPLWRAVFCSQGRWEIIELLLQAGSDKNHKNKHGISPVELANKIGNYDVGKFLTS